MMQFVAPAQLFLVLWLFAATAPAATALVNGSFVAFADTHSANLRPRNSLADSEEASPAGTSRRLAIDLHGTSDASGLILLALAQEEHFIPGDPRPVSTLSTRSDETPIALSSSLLHTAVQRHRPRVA